MQRETLLNILRVLLTERQLGAWGMDALTSILAQLIPDLTEGSSDG